VAQYGRVTIVCESLRVCLCIPFCKDGSLCLDTKRALYHCTADISVRIIYLRGHESPSHSSYLSLSDHHYGKATTTLIYSRNSHARGVNAGSNLGLCHTVSAVSTSEARRRFVVENGVLCVTIG
jgi:hypothetical protein